MLLDAERVTGTATVQMLGETLMKWTVDCGFAVAVALTVGPAEELMVVQMLGEAPMKWMVDRGLPVAVALSV